MSRIEDEFLFVAKGALRQREGYESIRVTAVRPSRNGPFIAYQHDLIGRPPPTSSGEPSQEPPADLILDGVARVLQVRWRGGPPILMKAEDEAWRAPLHRVYPKLFDVGGPHSWAGWRFIWLAAAEWITEIGAPSDWECGQTKEKFGSIRWYVYGKLTRRHQNVIRTMEIISGHTCEYCGAPGRLRKGGWAKVCCDVHAKGRGEVSCDD